MLSSACASALEIASAQPIAGYRTCSQMPSGKRAPEGMLQLGQPASPHSPWGA
ncbi:hypothetical protein Acid7E03_43930 [Acidisoma sp. 7E03]